VATEVWTLPDCPRCEKVKAALRARGEEFTERDIGKLWAGEDRDVEAMVQLALQGGAAPLVRREGVFLKPGEVEALLAEGDKCSSSSCHTLPR